MVASCLHITVLLASMVSALVELPVANMEMAFFKLLGLQLRGGSAKQPNAIKSDKNGFVRSINRVYFRYCMHDYHCLDSSMI